MKKIRLGLLFGGRSCEHEVSVISARSILHAMHRDQYQVSLIGIDKAGHWRLANDFEQLLSEGAVKALPAASSSRRRPADSTDSPAANPITLALHQHGNLSAIDGGAGHGVKIPAVDVIFPALHGTFGEDGAIQGVFEMAGIAYVGCGVAASAMAMDKILAKKIFAAAGIPQAPCIAAAASKWRLDPGEVIRRSETQLNYPLFVKPANLGSSVGISKAHQRAQLQDAIETAFQFDNKIVIEQSMQNCIEAECAVLGNAAAETAPRASVVGEIIPGAEFYDYATKYLDDKSELVIPANLPAAAAERARALALQAFAEIDGAGLARVDFFINRDSWEVTLNEVNTMPGFTPISMYPRLWAASGVPYAQLIDRLIQLALTTHRAKAALRRALK